MRAARHHVIRSQYDFRFLDSAGVVPAARHKAHRGVHLKAADADHCNSNQALPQVQNSKRNVGSDRRSLRHKSGRTLLEQVSGPPQSRRSFSASSTLHVEHEEDERLSVSRWLAGHEARVQLDTENAEEMVQELESRPANITYDYMTPNQSHLLDLTLAGHVPDKCLPAAMVNGESLSMPSLRSEHPQSLPQGHHLVYFPALVTNKSLLPDGTDRLHYPGPPFDQRLWTGGSIIFNNSRRGGLFFGHHAAKCTEKIQSAQLVRKDVMSSVKLTISRSYQHASSDTLDSTISKDYSEKSSSLTNTVHPELHAAIEETRDILFRHKKVSEMAGSRTIIEASKYEKYQNPGLTVRLTPNSSMLFRFSALTFNAHRIHLEHDYATQVEGHARRLVHGPLTLVLMLSVVRSMLSPGRMIRYFSYQNVAPLYEGQEMSICVKNDPDNSKEKRVWIVREDGALAVKANASIWSWED